MKFVIAYLNRFFWSILYFMQSDCIANVLIHTIFWSYGKTVTREARTTRVICLPGSWNIVLKKTRGNMPSQSVAIRLQIDPNYI